MTRDQMKTVIWVPIAAWLGLLAALGLTLLYAYLPHAPAKPLVGLTISALKASLIAWIFMRLDRSSALLRLTAPAGLAWLALLFLIGFADYLTRS